ncbi:Na+/H+ antiporter subunit E [Siccirubricoccus deserti]|uniref:Na+/H+ antiporter subunit E n=1 Tax=Siccirubricoccus deserti TaxID=2013562 RepID=A0A9X0QY14_9PROT|nr:Na+/H+ antiporter subunit E [Siccirubricoccus deserti]MBC4015995.1 Na+/H+ antiporter subunit E [Siccirubricoccus deserti]GGC39795.1 Na+/H+ antiporter subunit E [Siccirubricoccus deserti]
MRRWLPFPLVAAALLAMWLLLNESVSPGAILLGGMASLGACLVLVALDPPKGRFRRLRVVLGLAVKVLAEIIRSNNAVARLILRPGERQRRSGFVLIPLDMRNPYGLAALACIVTATPGTVWVEYDSTRSTMLLHVLDLIDEAQWRQIIKDHYERPLMEVFE